MILNKQKLIEKVNSALSMNKHQLQSQLDAGFHSPAYQLANAIELYVKEAFRVAIEEMYTNDEFENDLLGGK